MAAVCEVATRAILGGKSRGVAKVGAVPSLAVDKKGIVVVIGSGRGIELRGVSRPFPSSPSLFTHVQVHSSK